MPRVVLVLLAIAVAVLATASMWEDSATADEGAHIAAGLLKLQEGRLEFYATQAPLAEVLLAAPVAAAGYRVETWPPFENRPWLEGYLLLYRSGYDAQRILRLARLPAIALLLGLCFAVFWFVREVTGSFAAGIGGFALTGFCPTMLAHGRLATVDMAVTCFGFLATVLLLRVLRAPSLAVAGAAGVATGCALASKVSGALLVPFLLFVVGLWVLRTRRLDVRCLFVAGAVAVAAFMAIYLGIARSFDVTLPFRAYVAEIAAVRHFYAERHMLPQFLLGQFSQDGWPHYYLVALAVKTPLPVLLLLALAVVPAVRARRFEVLVCALFAALFLVVSSFSSLNLGIRHVLPIYPFVFAGIAISLERMRRTLLVLVALHVLVAVLAFPSYLSYFNPLIGSQRNADRVLIDSNLDWGQDLRRLGTWAREHDAVPLRVHYFGAGSVEHELPGAVRWAGPRPEPLPPGWFAVSRHFYRLSFMPGRADYDSYLRASHARYVTTIGGSIDVYRVP